jgi:hypothetical protein
MLSDNNNNSSSNNSSSNKMELSRHHHIIPRLHLIWHIKDSLRRYIRVHTHTQHRRVRAQGHYQRQCKFDHLRNNNNKFDLNSIRRILIQACSSLNNNRQLSSNRVISYILSLSLESMGCREYIWVDLNILNRKGSQLPEREVLFRGIMPSTVMCKCFLNFL